MTTLEAPQSLSATQLGLLQNPVDRALARSAETLSEMSGASIAFTSSTIKIVPLADVPIAVGRPGEPAVGIYVGMRGDGSGYLLLLMDEPVAIKLAALMLGDDLASVELTDELSASALAEAGNVACGAFMNEIGDTTGLELLAMPPVVVADMRGAIMDVAIADIAQEGDAALLITTQLGDQTAHAVEGELVELRLLVIPTPDTLAALLERLANLGNGNYSA
jgi:chemotaxis protein CheC